MNKNTISLLLGVTTTLIIGFALQASAGTNNLPKNVDKFQDGDITCYTYKQKSISCVYNPQPVETPKTKTNQLKGSYGA